LQVAGALAKVFGKPLLTLVRTIGRDFIACWGAGEDGCLRIVKRASDDKKAPWSMGRKLRRKSKQNVQRRKHATRRPATGGRAGAVAAILQGTLPRGLRRRSAASVGANQSPARRWPPAPAIWSATAIAADRGCCSPRLRSLLK
jgi:hypothetical protein